LILNHFEKRLDFLQAEFHWNLHGHFYFITFMINSWRSEER